MRTRWHMGSRGGGEPTEVRVLRRFTQPDFVGRDGRVWSGGPWCVVCPVTRRADLPREVPQSYCVGEEMLADGPAYYYNVTVIAEGR